MRERVNAIAKELRQTGTIRDPARSKLLDTRKAVVANWMQTAETLDTQGETVLAGEVRYFARHLPPVLTDREKLAAELVRHIKERTVDSAVASKARKRDEDVVR